MPEDFVSAIREAKLTPLQISAKPAPSRLMRVNCQRVCLDFASLSPAMLFSGAMPDNCYTLLFVTKCLQKGRSFNFSIDYNDGYMGFFPPGGLLDGYTPEGYENATLTVSANVFLQAVERSFPEIPEKILKNGAGLRIGVEEQKKLRELLRLVQKIIDHPMDHIFCQSARSQLESDLIDAFLSALSDGSKYTTAKPMIRTEKRWGRLRQARDFLAENCHTPVSSVSLSAELNMSKRGVEMLFQDLLGVSPNAFIRNQRLHGVRQALREAEATPGIVKHTAYQWGFWHLGHFCHEYQSLFGELPMSTALRHP